MASELATIPRKSSSLICLLGELNNDSAPQKVGA